jgi:hypothetical protein
VSKDDDDQVHEPEWHLEFKLTKVRKDTVWRRCLKWMTSPWRIVAGIPVAFFLDWLNSSGHHLTEGGFWVAYACWFPATFIIFWLYELHAQAGGRRLNG